MPYIQKGGYLVKQVVEKPTYGYLKGCACPPLFCALDYIISGYIQELLRKASELCAREETEQSSSILPEPLSSGYDHPHNAEAMRRHKSRSYQFLAGAGGG